MGWPKGKPRGPRKVQADHITGTNFESPATNKPPSGGRWKMKAAHNWESMDGLSESPDRFHIPKNILARIPGMSFQWVTKEVYGQIQHQHMADFTKTGWTPVHQEDFDGIFDGMFMPRGAEGEINNGGLVLMARPQEITDRALEKDYRKAKEQIQIKERALRGGDLPGVRDADHESALRTNRIKKHREPIAIPTDSGEGG